MGTKTETVDFTAEGARLSGALHLPTGAPRAAVVLHGATGVRHRFYHAFVQWLAETKGLACLTYDYRDFGASSTGPMRRSTATMTDWGVHDQAAAQSFMQARFPDLPLWVIGHSLGGMMMQFHPHVSQIERVLSICSGSGYWGNHPWPYRAGALSFWYGHGPLGALIAGYMPGSKLGLGADLPAAVYWQWRRWCVSREFLEPEIGRSLPQRTKPGLRAPISIVGITDDQLIPPAAVAKLKDFYPDALAREITVRPSDYGLSKIGHFGAFAPRNAALWPHITEDFG